MSLQIPDTPALPGSVEMLYAIIEAHNTEYSVNDSIVDSLTKVCRDAFKVNIQAAKAALTVYDLTKGKEIDELGAFEKARILARVGINALLSGFNKIDKRYNACIDDLSVELTGDKGRINYYSSDGGLSSLVEDVWRGYAEGQGWQVEQRSVESYDPELTIIAKQYLDAVSSNEDAILPRVVENILNSAKGQATRARINSINTFKVGDGETTLYWMDPKFYQDGTMEVTLHIGLYELSNLEVKDMQNVQVQTYFHEIMMPLKRQGIIFGVYYPGISIDLGLNRDTEIGIANKLVAVNDVFEANFRYTGP